MLSGFYARLDGTSGSVLIGDGKRMATTTAKNITAYIVGSGNMKISGLPGLKIHANRLVVFDCGCRVTTKEGSLDEEFFNKNCITKAGPHGLIKHPYHSGYLIDTARMVLGR